VGSLYWPPVSAEFNVWLLIVGLVLGAGLILLVVIDSRRAEAEIDADERPREAAWLSLVLAEDGFDVSPEAAERLLILHRAYLGAPPPDEIAADVPAGELPTAEGEGGFGGSGQRPPTSTGDEPTAAPDASTSETPNVASLDRPDTAGTGPIQ
jgi:hypothetical protein